MKTSTKTFDCVEMKEKIQEKLLREYAGMTDEEVDKKRDEKLSTSEHPAARLWRRMADTEKRQ